MVSQYQLLYLVAVGTTIGVILSTLTRSLKSVVKSVGDGLKTLGSKIAGIMLRLIGLMVGFIFKTSRSVISFLDRNTWLLGPG